MQAPPSCTVCVCMYVRTYVHTLDVSPTQVIEAFVNDTIGTVEQFVSYTANTLRSDALRCGPLSNVYVGAINLVCRQNLNSLVCERAHTHTHTHTH